MSALVMMIAMSATVSFAADNEVAFTTTKTADGVDVVVSLNTTYTDIQTIGLFLDVSGAEGATVTTTNGDAQLKYVAAQKMVSLAFAPSDLHKYVSGTALGTISFTGVSDNFSIALMPKTARTTSKITSVAAGDLMYGSTVAFDPAAVGATITVKSSQTLGYETTLAYDGTSKGFQFVATNTETGKSVSSEPKALPTVENLGDVELGCNIVNIPADVELDDVKSVLSVFARWVAEVPVTE